jgi:AcrR family transcriptional regulator
MGSAKSNGKGAQTQRAVLEAAIARFGREGYRATSVADIARDAGVGGTVAYAYFPGKEALFLAAVDEDAAAVINEALNGSFSDAVADWRQTMLFASLAALERHPLARRLLAGLEPEVTDRVLETAALNDLRKACAERLGMEQMRGTVRADVDPITMANGTVAILLSLLMSVVQLGGKAALLYADDVAAVFAAALESAPQARRPSKRAAVSKRG